MKKAKLIFWLLLIGIVALLVFQNQEYFLARTVLKADFYVTRYQTPPFPNGTFIVASFAVGFLLAYILGLSDRFKARRAIRSLNETVSSHQETISTLKKELASLQTDTQAEAVEMTGSQMTGSQEKTS